MADEYAFSFAEVHSIGNQSIISTLFSVISWKRLFCCCGSCGNRAQFSYVTSDQSTRAKREEHRNAQKNHGRFISLLQLANRDLWLITLGTLFVIFGAAFDTASTVFLGSTLDVLYSYSASKSVQLEEFIDLLPYFVIFFFIYVFESVMSFFNTVCFGLAARRMITRTRIRLLSWMMIQDISFFDKNSTGHLISRLNVDVTKLNTIATAAASLLSALFRIIVGIVVMMGISWPLTLLSIALVPLSVLISLIYGRVIRSLSKKIVDGLADSSNAATSCLQNVRTIRAYGQEQTQTSKYNRHIKRVYHRGRLLTFLGAGFSSVTIFIGGLTTISLIFAGSLLIKYWDYYRPFGLYIMTELTVGRLISFLNTAQTVEGAMSSLSSVYTTLMEAYGGTHRLIDILNQKPTLLVAGKGGGTFQEAAAIQPTIQLANVHFSYPTAPDRKILHGVNLKITPGQSVALVGSSGSGKSTIFQLLLNYYKPVDGKVLVAGADVSQVDPAHLRSLIAYVPQDPVLFEGTIRDNILFGQAPGHYYTQTDIQRAAQDAFAHDFIMSLPNQYESRVGERGANLSGGQKQRIAIARAFLRQPKILMLDEATSALDTHSEVLVQRAIDRFISQGKSTVLVIAHRLSTVAKADVIVVMDRGDIVEQGTHDELVAKGTVYARLVHGQQVKG
ncbi:ABC transporter subfamily B member 10-like [Carpediemonas membranifera]|uniref:ABC transporter subfamily B member 10-like n=1 Tax=Carpediemonas membranifera TaxID=201153 RepID=A0A8J6B0C5_9EUKA|nr:ABC transporter subfamily B member 10-like [Carpediemonas membranifera]|eukprot:KAG9395700.1 ABC transporter subfamily B member 10-like [Carpediemonas membranifera]